MNKEEMIQEMLKEIKDLKDLAKSELPIVSREYINANKVRTYASVLFGLALLIVSILLGFYCGTDMDSSRPLQFFAGLGCLIFGVTSSFMIICSIGTLIDLYLQPRRMAIKAVTSLFKE